MPGAAGSGRRKQPANVLQLKGRRPGKDSGGRDIPTPPKFKRSPPEMPEWLTPEARAEWHRVVPGLSVLDILKPEDRAMLAAYCESWASFRVLCELIAEQGQTIEHETTTTGPQGTRHTYKVIVNPLLAARDRVGKEMRGYAAQFGLSPSSEMALGKVADDDGDDENLFE